MSEPVEIVLVGPQTARGTAVLSALQPFKDVIDIVGVSSDAGGAFDWRTERIIQPIDTQDWTDIRAVIATEPLSVGLDVPVLHLDASDVPLQGQQLQQHQRMPHPAARAVAELLESQTGLERIDLTVIAAASSAERAGMDELRDQTIALLNFKPLKTDAFGRRLAFDVLLDTDSTRETLIASDLAALLPKAMPIDVRHVVVPAFIGTAVDVRVHGAMDAPALQHAVEGMALHADRLGEVGGSNRLHASRLTVHPGGARVWLLLDDLDWGVSGPVLAFLAQVLSH